MTEIAVAALLYAAVVFALGWIARGRAGTSPEEYFLAGRRLGSLVLFMALFGTNATSFVLVGIPGMAYQHGIGVFGLNAPIIALGIPLTFWAVGSPARRMGRRLGAMTPAELYAARFGSRAIGLALFALFTVYTVPYMVQAVKGAAIVVSESTDGALPRWSVGAGLLALSLVYTSLGGMRATAWTNVFQGALFVTFMVLAIGFVAASLGGPAAATRAVAGIEEGLLRVERAGGWALFTPGGWTSWGLVIALTVIGFPHMLVRLMTADGEESLKRACRLYPVALALLWVPAVLLGFWGRAAFPGLADPDEIFFWMTREHLPAALGSLGFLAVLAAVMSTLDAQLLTLSSMLVRDVVPGEAEARQVRLSRAFSLGLAALIFALAQLWDDSVFAISRWAFEGYTTLFPVLLLGVRWRRLNVPGALASLAVGNLVLVAGRSGWIPSPVFLPVFWALAAGFAAALAVSLATRPAPEEATRRAFGPARMGAPQVAGSSRK